MKNLILLLISMLLFSACGEDSGEADAPQAAAHDGCSDIPRPANAALRQLSSAHDWYQVYEAGPRVFALVEPFQFQEAIAYLILGDNKALLFDSGIGLVPIRPVVEALTDLPIEVLNSHTHFDHVGGNYEFESVIAIDTVYTRANMAGFPHSELAGEVVPEALCKGAPAGADLGAFHTRPWTASRFVRGGEVLELGNRDIEVLHVPGHTPDAVALVDRDNGLIWTGDTYYDAGLWLFVPETDLDAYEESLARLIELAETAEYLLPAHNTARVDPARLKHVAAAVKKMRSGTVEATTEDGHRLVFEIDGITIVTAQPLLDRERGNSAGGGSGLTTWPK